MSDPDDEVAELYGLPLEEFTAARNALARRRRDDGDREAADAVKELSKPTVAAWAANQLARRHQKEMGELLEAGDELRATHEALLSGDRGADMAGAAQRERAAVGRLVDRARKLDLSDAVLERVAETLHAAAGSDEVREQLRRGMVVREQQAAMFGGLGAGARAPAAPRRRKRASRTSDESAAQRRERERAEREERERSEKLQAARAELRRLRSEHGKARRAAEAAERRLARAREEFESRQEETEAARSRRDDAERELADAERLIERLER